MSAVDTSVHVMVQYNIYIYVHVLHNTISDEGCNLIVSNNYALYYFFDVDMIPSSCACNEDNQGGRTVMNSFELMQVYILESVLTKL